MTAVHQQWGAVALICFGIGSYMPCMAQQWEVFDMVGHGLPSNTIYAITQDQQGLIWAATDWGLCRYDGEEWTILQQANSGLPDNYLLSLAVDEDDRLWIGTVNAGIAILDGNDWTYLNMDNSPLVTAEVKGLTIDHQGWVWIATELGLQCFTGDEWFLYDSSPESHLGYQFWGSNISATAVREDGLVAVATRNGGLTYISENDFIYYTAPQDNFPDNSQNAVAFDSNGDRWLACPAAGLIRHAGPHIGGPWFQYNGFTAGLPDDTHTSIVIDEADRKWVGTEAAGLIRFDGPGNWSALNTNNSGLPDDHLRCLFRDAQGDLWVGTNVGGVARYRLFTHVPGGPLATTLSVHPNPFRDHVVADLRGYGPRVEWRLLDVQGRELAGGVTAGGAQVTIELPGLQLGAYLLVVTDQVSKGVARLVSAYF